MEISDQELRALVRDAIARHGRSAGASAEPVPDRPRSFAPTPATDDFSSPAAAPTMGSCLIEPGVRCNHCGYCQSLGH